MPQRTSGISKLIDLVFLLRPMLLCASCTFFFAGMLASLQYQGNPYGMSTILAVIPNLVVFMLVVSSAFVVNQIFDVKSDAINKKNYLLPCGVVTRTWSAILLGILCISTILLGSQRDGLVKLLALSGLGLGLAYSVPPFRLKSRPVADLLANTFGFGFIAFAMGWLALSRFGPELVTRSVPYILAMAAMFLNTCIPDEEGDRLTGDRTTCVAWGRAAVSRAALILLAIATFAGFAMGETACFIASLASMPLLVAVAVEPTSKNSVLASQFAARAFFVIVSVRAPLLAVLGVISYLGSKAYYQRRFGITYPRLAGAEQSGKQSTYGDSR